MERLLLTKDEALAAFWYFLKMMGPEQREKLRLQLKDRGPGLMGERELLYRATIQFDRDETAARIGKSIIRGH